MKPTILLAWYSSVFIGILAILQVFDTTTNIMAIKIFVALLIIKSIVIHDLG